MGLRSQYINNEPSSKGLVAHWPLDIFRNGAIVRDVAGVNNGTAVNSPKLAHPGMLFVPASTQHIDCGQDASLDVTTLSITAWVKLAATFVASGSVVNKGDVDADLGFTLEVDGNRKVAINGAGVPGVPGDETVPLSEWTFIGASLVGTAGKIYVNDSPEEAETISAPASKATFNLLIGTKNGSGEGNFQDYFNGSIAQVRLYNRIITEAEFHDVYRMTRGRFNI